METHQQNVQEELEEHIKFRRQPPLNCISTNWNKQVWYLMEKAIMEPMNKGFQVNVIQHREEVKLYCSS